MQGSKRAHVWVKLCMRMTLPSMSKEVLKPETQYKGRPLT